MASPQFDSNTWYSLQNSGTKFFLGCNSISICGADTSDRTNFEWFQITKVGDQSPYYIRPKSRNVDDNGQPFCININTGQPSLTLCNNVSATWGTGYWNQRDAGNGLFFYNTQQGDSNRLFVGDGGSWSLPDYNGASASDLDHMRWNIASLGAINDQSYSTAPAVIANAPSTNVVVTPTSSTDRAASTLSGTSGTVVVTVTSSAGSVSSAQTSNSNGPTLSLPTVPMIQTSIVTATPSSSRSVSSQSSSSMSSGPIASMTSSSSARPVPAAWILAAVPIVVTLLQLGS